MNRIALTLAVVMVAGCAEHRVTSPTAASLTAPRTSPLVIMDGEELIVTDLDLIDTKSISHVEVIKGQAAMKKYGERGRNGVILITSKSVR